MNDQLIEHRLKEMSRLASSIKQGGVITDRLGRGLRTMLLEWLEQFSDGGILVMDDRSDYFLLVDLLDGLLEGWSANVLCCPRDFFESSFLSRDMRHYALHGARALGKAIFAQESET